MSVIGQLNERSLHNQLKRRYAESGGLVEQKVDGFVVDVLIGDEIVEIQTGGMIKLRRKLDQLVPAHRVRIVYPIASTIRILKTAPNGELLSNRHSPRRGRPEEAFRELGWIADMLPNARIVVDILMVAVTEVRSDDGKGSWRRRGVSIVERRLDRIDETITLVSPDDYLAMLPDCAGTRFTNSDLCECASLPYRVVQPMTGALKKMGLLSVERFRGREHEFTRG